MILKIFSDLPSFKTIEFHEGLNILLSEKSPTSESKKTRNSAGKTSLIEILHFLLGSSLQKSKNPLFLEEELFDVMFFGEFELQGIRITVGRKGSDPQKIFIKKTEAEYLLLDFQLDKKTGNHYIKVKEWKEVLGTLMFGLPFPKSLPFEQSGSPSFRSMYPYFARRQEEGGYSAPHKHFPTQKRADWQVCLSYLMDLDWQIPLDLQKVREREGQLVELKKAAKGGVFGQVIGSAAELRPLLVQAENKSERLRGELEHFKVEESYSRLSDEAASLRNQMLGLERMVVSLKEKKTHLVTAMSEEKYAGSDALTQLYGSVGLVFTDTTVKTFNEVQAFYDSIIENRKRYLGSELNDLDRILLQHESSVSSLDKRRSEILQFLRGKGAFEDFILMQKELADVQAEAATLKQRYQASEMLEGQTAKLEHDRSSIWLRLLEDHSTRHLQIETLTLQVLNTISQLYDDRKGGLIVEVTENGPEFKITIQGDRGKGGISNMEVFCLDVALYRSGSYLPKPNFLIHDSHLFDGVDERQVANAILYGWKVAVERQGQYIVLLNSDVFERLPLPKTPELQTSILNVRLSDKGEDGGLFGFRFD